MAPDFFKACCNVRTSRRTPPAWSWLLRNAAVLSDGTALPNWGTFHIWLFEPCAQNISKVLSRPGQFSMIPGKTSSACGTIQAAWEVQNSWSQSWPGLSNALDLGMVADQISSVSMLKPGSLAEVKLRPSICEIFSEKCLNGVPGRSWWKNTPVRETCGRSTLYYDDLWIFMMTSHGFLMFD